MDNDWEYLLSAYAAQSLSAIHHTLRQPRRRLAIVLLRQGFDTLEVSETEADAAATQMSSGRAIVSVRQLARKIVMVEQNVSRDHATGDVYHNVYTSLIQTHLPKLDDVNAVKYDSDRKTVAPGCNLTALAAVVMITSPISRLLFQDPMAGACTDGSINP